MEKIFRFNINLLTLVGDNDLAILPSILLDKIYVVTWPYLKVTYTLHLIPKVKNNCCLMIFGTQGHRVTHNTRPVN